MILFQLLRIKLAQAKARYYDRKIGIDAEGSLHREIGARCDRERNLYQPSYYGRLEKMVRHLRFTSDDVFVDFGCGKGRVVFFVALHKLKKVIGVEVDGALIECARRNLSRLRMRNSPVEFVHGDAGLFDVREGTVFFMFNPFGEATLAKVLQNIKESLSSYPRKIRIVYYAPVFMGLLDRQDWLVREGEIENSECLVWRSR